MNSIAPFLHEYQTLGIDAQLDYDKLYLYSLITHSTAIEGSTVTEIENRLLFDEGLAPKGRNIIELNMNLDLKEAYGQAIRHAREHDDVTVSRLCNLSALTMRRTGTEYHTALGDFSSAKGELRLVNVSAGVGGKSYMAFNKVPARLDEFCRRLNESRMELDRDDVDGWYDLSFDAHFYLVTIHPWADGNGRMARLLMHWIQIEAGLIPVRLEASEKAEYIRALIDTREADDPEIFRSFMRETAISQLKQDITEYKTSI